MVTSRMVGGTGVGSGVSAPLWTLRPGAENKGKAGSPSNTIPVGGAATDGKGGAAVTKADLVDKVAEKTGFTKKDSARFVEALFEALTEGLAAGNKISVVGFGTFSVRKRAARRGRNPQTGTEIKIAARKVPVFRPGKALREAVR
jgi:DNA-binding protein HU-beta